MTDFTKPTSPAEHAAMESWLSGSADTTGMLLAVRAALAVQREEIAQAIEKMADEATLYASSTSARLAFRSVIAEGARIAREYGQG